MAEDKQLDLVIYAATSYTGKIACEYLAGKESSFLETFKWAIAGRNEHKLELLKADLREKFDTLGDLQIIIADSSDLDALDLVTKPAKAVISFAGPYSKYGSKLIESCVKNGAHYSDINGELFWVSEMMEKFEEAAQVSKVRLVPSCGSVSLPYDWGVNCVVKFIREQLNEDTKYARGVIMDFKTTVSGGTAASVLEITAPENIAKAVEILQDPQAINPKDCRNNLDKPDPDNYVWDPVLKTYLAPFIGAPTDVRIVRRSNALLKYGPDFTYDEYIKCSSWSGAKAKTWTYGLINKSLVSKIGRSLINRMTPNPGQGATMEVLKKGFLKAKLYGEAAESGKKVVCDVSIEGNPGYLITSRMIVEAGIDLALNASELDVYGFQTTASGLSPKFFEAMLKNGMSVETKLFEEC